MKSAGNDIVALQAIDKQRTCHSAFYSKFITVSEQSLYEQTAMPFESFVWLLWSVKEAVYKYLKRDNIDLVFSPSKIITQYIDIPVNKPADNFKGNRWESDEQPNGQFYKGSVMYKTHTLYFRSKLQEAFVATVVNNDEDFANVYWGIQLIDEAGYESQSKAVRSFLLSKLKQVLPAGSLRIEKVDGCPVLMKDDKLMNIPVSLAHHGQFVTYSFCLNHRLS